MPVGETKTFLVPNIANEENDTDITLEESMVVNITPLKSLFREIDKKTQSRREEYEIHRSTLKER